MITIDLRIHRLLGYGVYSEVFDIAGHAYKLFLKGSEIPPKQTFTGRKQVFRNQCEAYRLGATDAVLVQHIPAFFGAVHVEDVIDANGLSIRERFLLDCCYVMQTVNSSNSPEPITAPGVRDNPGVAEALQRFKLLGIETLDASIFDASDSEQFKLIDFETPFRFS